MISMSDLGARYRRLALPYFLPMALLIFTASGFAGLIYQSIWSHYLKLFLGHAAYAQTLVLAIFMGGMALGAWLASRWSPRWKDLLLVYALIEAAIGIASLVFHDVFQAATAFSFDRVIPWLGSPFAVQVFKWSLAAALILPQSILLGMTFPLMTGGVLRIHPERSGYAIAMLYFTNSLGAAVGVLASGFYLIEAAGLPGTLAAAAAMNLAVAAAAMLLPRGAARLPAPAASAAARAPVPHQRLLLAVAALTGLSSFMYEIGWIRMLALVLGSSTHAFELMLSAFILGIAFGGLWIRRRIDSSLDTMRLLGIVQVVMGLAALATLPVYASSFTFMQEVLRTVAPTAQGYVGFNVASHAVCLAVMFPAAFCAGMTLPLITVSLMRAGAGERAIGQVYGANTLGAILGVMAAVHVAMPLLGVKGLIVAGAVIDIALGVALFAVVAGPWRMAWAGGAAAVGCAAALVAVLGVQLNAHHMASGVYRHGVLADESKDKVLFHRDGKTATVSVTASGQLYSLRTNGKTDGAINLDPKGPRNGDEATMTLLGALPQFYMPDAQRIGVIGFGTGMTANVLLASERFAFVDTVEIEPAIVEAARLMRGANERVFADARHRTHYEDAKTYFSSQRERFDLIVSEPSNPWVSGVSSLFTTEFYRDMRRYLRDGGLLVQWIQLYELSPMLVATIMAALHENFSDYDIWVANTGDILVVAVNGGAIPAIDPAAFDNPKLRADLQRIHVHGMDDLRLHRLGSRAALAPYFLSFSVQPNSDFYPTLDLHAPATRFMRATAAEIPGMVESPLPLLRLFDPKDQVIDAASITSAQRTWWPRAAWVMQAVAVRNYLRHGEHRYLDEVSFALADDLILLRATLVECSIKVTRGALRVKLGELSRYVSAHLPARDAQELWAVLSRSQCAARLPEADRRWLRLHAAVASGEPGRMVRASQAILDAEPALEGELLGHALSANMAGYILAGHGGDAVKAYHAHRGRLRTAAPAWQAVFRFLIGQADFGRMVAGPAADQK